MQTTLPGGSVGLASFTSVGQLRFKRAVLASLGRNEEGRSGLEVRLCGGTEGDDRDACFLDN